MLKPVRKGSNMTRVTLQPPQFQMIRQEPKRRDLVVSRVERLSPAMIRIVLTGDALADFSTYAPDDHVKLFVSDEEGGRVLRDFTPRRIDVQRRELTQQCDLGIALQNLEASVDEFDAIEDGLQFGRLVHHMDRSRHLAAVMEEAGDAELVPLVLGLEAEGP